MKRTKNMIFAPSDESWELCCYTENNFELWRPTFKNMVKKVEKGIYDTEKAIDAWYHVMNVAAKMYYEEFGKKFTVQERFSAAVWFESVSWQNASEEELEIWNAYEMQLEGE